jgi:hypothetical protein
MKLLTTPRPVPVDLSKTPDQETLYHVLDNWAADFEALLERSQDARRKSDLQFLVRLCRRNMATLRAGKALTGEEAMELGGICVRVLDNNREPVDIQSEAAYVLMYLEPDFAETIRQRFAANKKTNWLPAFGIEKVSP